MSDPDLDIQVHDRGSDRGIDGILRLIDIAGQERPLDQLLAEMCPHLAAIAASDVVSVYVREVGPAGDLLVMRGNVGFPRAAIGTVSLKMGEGITGLVAECMRPVSVAIAAGETHYKHVPGIGEERYPSFLGVPLLTSGCVAGVLVMQRRQAEAFSTAEIALATALGAPIALAIESAKRRLADRQRGRSVRLVGTPVVSGTAMGRVAIVPTLASLPEPAELAGGNFDLAGAVERLAIDLERATRKLRVVADAEIKRAIDNLGLALKDQRFRDRITSRREDAPGVARGEDTRKGGVVASLKGVAREYARVPYRVPVRDGAIEPALAERAREVEDLCVLLYGAAVPRLGGTTPILPPGAVWVGERIGAFVALCAVARGAAALVCDGRVEEGPGLAIARAAGIPVLGEVDGLFAWLRPGDLVVCDADTGVLRVNPAASSVESFRRDRASD